ncbi:hypothetical protein JY97_11815 [Alkalispirochaeta odontotermitis]|nr:hypothetical protein JY97_11815 [Alkalispirochaeta odontotermitis]
MLYNFEGKNPEFRGERIFVAPSADIIGSVILCENSSVWFNCTLRGDIELIFLGESSNIQDGSSVHTDDGAPTMIGANVTIGHNCVIHGCEIKEGCLIGMGSVILTGAVIGKNSLIGAGSLVTENMSIPERSLVLGSPARVIKKLEDAVLEKCLKNSARYVLNAHRYLDLEIGRP